MLKEIISLSVPNLNGNEKKYVNEAISSQWVSTGGEFIERFENEIKKYVKIENAAACQSGTAGLHLAAQVLGIDNNDEVLAPCLTFIAAVNPIRYVGACPVFLDCDDSLCIDPVKLRDFCESQCDFDGEKLINKTSKKVVKAIIIVHVFGNLANLDEIMEICNIYKILVIEDATEALGSFFKNGKFEGRHAGTIGDVGVFSFNGNKIITSGGGGMVVSNKADIIDKARYLSSQAKDNSIYFIHGDIGYNYRMTNIQGAMGVAQMENLEEFIQSKKRNYFLYKNEIENINGLHLLGFADYALPNYWFYSLFINDEKYGINRDDLLHKFERNNIQTRPIWELINRQKPYSNFQSYRVEQANYYHQHILNIPCSSNLTEEQVLRVLEVLKNT